MTSTKLQLIWLLWKWCMAGVAVYVMWGLAEHRGRIAGEQGLAYWQGWQDAMIATDYGTKPYDSER